jgi:hypothetical protein
VTNLTIRQVRSIARDVRDQRRLYPVPVPPRRRRSARWQGLALWLALTGVALVTYGVLWHLMWTAAVGGGAR